MRISDWSSDVCSSDLPGLECHDQARRAETALQPVLLVQRLLQRAEPVVLRHRLDRLDHTALQLNGKQQAGPYRPAIDADRASAADAVRSEGTRLNSSH